MKAWRVLGAAVLVSGWAASASAVPALFDWTFQIATDTYAAPLDSNGVPVTTDTSGLPSPLFSFGGFDWTKGLGTVQVNFAPGAAGSYFVGAFFDQDIDEPTNTFFNETSSVAGAPTAGQSWQIAVQDPQANHSASDNYASGGIWDNLVSGLLSNGSGPDTIGDVAMAVAWDFTLTDVEQAVIRFVVSMNQPASGFYLAQFDRDSDATLYFSSSLDIRGQQPIPEPGTLLLLGSGLVAAAASRRRRAQRS